MSKKIFKDYPKSKIIAKLREVQIYEKTYLKNIIRFKKMLAYL